MRSHLMARPDLGPERHPRDPDQGNLTASGLWSRLLASLRCVRQSSSRPAQAPHNSLADRIAALADKLAAVIEDAHQLRFPAPTPVSNAVLDLRAWAAHVVDKNATRPTTVDGTALVAYVRALPDRQFLALLADLPWARLDALLDAVQVSDQVTSSRWGQTP